MKPTVLRPRADADVDDALIYYVQESHQVADSFLEAVWQAREHISRVPGSGSPRYGDLLSVPGLRFWLLSKFPYAVFYFERDDHIDIVRVLHTARDVPARL